MLLAEYFFFRKGKDISNSKISHIEILKSWQLWELRLPERKLTELQQLVRNWQGCTRRDLESLVGKFSHAIKVVWARFMEEWNGVSLLWEFGACQVQVTFMTDALGNFGCGALWQARWLQWQWAPAVGSGGSQHSVHVPVGIHLKRSEEENSWYRNQNTSPNYPERAETFEGVWPAQANQSDAAMLWEAACMCYSGFLHSGEVVAPLEISYDLAVHMSYGDVRVSNVGNPQYLEVRIKASKTDPFRKGVTV